MTLGTQWGWRMKHQVGHTSARVPSLHPSGLPVPQLPQLSPNKVLHRQCWGGKPGSRLVRAGQAATGESDCHNYPHARAGPWSKRSQDPRAVVTGSHCPADGTLQAPPPGALRGTLVMVTTAMAPHGTPLRSLNPKLAAPPSREARPHHHVSQKPSPITRVPSHGPPAPPWRSRLVTR